MNHRLATRRPLKSDRIKNTALCRETKILGCVVRGVCVMKRSRRDFGWALAINTPGTSAIDGLSVHIQPGAYVKKNMLHFFGDGSIRTRTDVQQQIAVLADNVNELVNNKFRRLERVIVDVAPRLVAHRGA